VKNKEQNTNNSQLDQANAALVALSQNVSSSDRSFAQERYSQFTVIKYLKGRGKDLDTAMDLLGIFRMRISDREKKISEVNQG
jgi:hypothetical protein